MTIKPNNVTIGNPRNITNKSGYDNQPFFHPDKSVLYYVTLDDAEKTNVVEYDLKTSQSKLFTQTSSDREYSPTVTPDKKFISCIIQRDSGQQDLGKYPINGGAAEVIIDNLTVGYHAWADDDRLLLFVLGEPNTLRLYSVKDKKNVIMAENIGRSLHRIPGTKSVSFIHKISDDQWVIKKVDEKTGAIVTIVDGIKGSEYLAWAPDGKILMSDGKKIFFIDPTRKSFWQEVNIPSAVPLNTISRLAVDPKGKTLAVVVNE
ncbi:MAG: hypothetical protein ACOYXT_12465 [Bacteroidota bacterium]